MHGNRTLEWYHREFVMCLFQHRVGEPWYRGFSSTTRERERERSRDDRSQSDHDDQHLANRETRSSRARASRVRVPVVRMLGVVQFRALGPIHRKDYHRPRCPTRRSPLRGLQRDGIAVERSTARSDRRCKALVSAVVEQVPASIQIHGSVTSKGEREREREREHMNRSNRQTLYSVLPVSTSGERGWKGSGL